MFKKSMGLEVVKDAYTCSVYFGEGKGYQELTTEIIDKIDSGELIITEYQETPLGEVIYLSAKSTNN